MTESYVTLPVKHYGERVTASRDARLANLLGAVAVGLTDRIQGQLAGVTELDLGAATALIALLDFSPAGPVRRLSEVCGLTHSGAVRLVDRLEAAGYAHRSPGGNGRSVTVELTPVGRGVALRLRAAREEALTGQFAELTAEERNRLTELCEILVTSITEQRMAQRASGLSPVGGALCRMCDFRACGRDRGRCPAEQST